MLKHSRQFNKFLIDGCSTYNCTVPDIDFVFSTKFQYSANLFWLSLIYCAISTLSFLRFTPNSETVNFTGCRNLRDDDFIILKEWDKIDQIYVSFTDVKPGTLFLIIQNKPVKVLGACGVEFKLQDCSQLMSKVFGIFYHLASRYIRILTY